MHALGQWKKVVNRCVQSVSKCVCVCVWLSEWVSDCEWVRGWLRCLLTHVSVGDVQQVLHPAGGPVCVLAAEGLLQDDVVGLLGGEDLVDVLGRPPGVHLARLPQVRSTTQIQGQDRVKRGKREKPQLQKYIRNDVDEIYVKVPQLKIKQTCIKGIYCFYYLTFI